MTERWVSVKKHYCDVCKCWISGHPMNVSNHQMSESHQAKQQRALHEMQVKEKQRKADQRCLVAEVQRIEAAGLQAFRNKDIFQTNKNRSMDSVIALLDEGQNRSCSKDCSSSTQLSVGVISAKPRLVTPVVEEVSDQQKQVFSDSTENTVSSAWITSFDTTTNAPFYFNSITGESSTVHPSLSSCSRSTPSQTPVHDEQQGQKVISELLPSVNAMTDAYKSFLIANQTALFPSPPLEEQKQEQPTNDKRTLLGALPKRVADIVRHRLEASKAASEATAKRDMRSPLSSETGNDPQLPDQHSSYNDKTLENNDKMHIKVCAESTTDDVGSMSTRLPARYIPISTYEGCKPGYVFTTLSGITGYYWDATIHTGGILHDKAPREVFPKTSGADELVTALNTPSKEFLVNPCGLGAWVMVSPEESKFGDTTKESIPTVPLPPTKLELERAKPSSERTTSRTIAALNEDAETSGQLNFDDLKRTAKLTFSAEQMEFSSEGVHQHMKTITFKKRLPKPKTCHAAKSKQLKTGV